MATSALALLLVVCQLTLRHQLAQCGQYVSGGSAASSWSQLGGDRPAPAYYSPTDSWISEDLWPKGEKSPLIRVKLIKPLPKELNLYDLRSSDSYLSDVSLDFDAPFRTEWAHNGTCQIDVKSYSDGYTSPTNHVTTVMGRGPSIQVQVSGVNCTAVPFDRIVQYADNLTHLVIRDTSLEQLTKYMFGVHRLERISRIDIIGNGRLKSVNGRAFDGLNRLNYLALINNGQLERLDSEAFAGVKACEELIFIGNGQLFARSQLSDILRASASRILPNLIHLHVGGQVLSESREQQGQGSASLFIKSHDHAKVMVSSVRRNEDRGAGIKLNKDDLISANQLKYLQLSDCDLTAIHPLTFVPVMFNLVGLNLGGNPRLDLRSLKRSLQIFTRPLNLNLTLNSSDSKKVLLEQLDLSNSISSSSVPNDLLVTISKSNISQLYLSGLTWRLLGAGDLPPMPQLRVLHVDNCHQLRELDENTFVGFEGLRKLSLRGNILNELPLNLLEPLARLEFLDLSGSRRDGADSPLKLDIPRKFFIRGTKLKEVNLSYKDLDPLPRNIFLGLFKAEKVHLRGCGLKFIEYLTFFPLKSIVYIDLSENFELISSIRRTHEDTFVGLEAVEMVRMSMNNITTSDLNDFSIFRRISEHVRFLDLSHNKIEQLSKNSFKNFTELRHLDLSHNQIKSWSNITIFTKNQFITTLDISGNQIYDLSPEMLADFRRLKNLSFAENPLQCSCNWRGPLLLLGHGDSGQRSSSLQRNRKLEEQFEAQLQNLVRRQQEIVSDVFLSDSIQAPPRSIIDWLNMTSVHFIQDHHPLRSRRHYHCQVKGYSETVVFKDFYSESGLMCNSNANNRAKVSFAILTLVAIVLFTLTVIMLIVAFRYHSTLRTLFNTFDENYLHKFNYDAFVSYSVNDSDFIFNMLIPNLEVKCSSLDDLVTPLTLKLCVYDRDFLAGRSIAECITESVMTSRKVILLISNSFVASPWCRFETELAHSTLLDQNREGLVLIKLDRDINMDMVEKTAPQLHFLLKTRIYLEWPGQGSSDEEQHQFWKKLKRTLGHQSVSSDTNDFTNYTKVEKQSELNSLTSDLNKWPNNNETIVTSYIDVISPSDETVKPLVTVQLSHKEHLSVVKDRVLASNGINVMVKPTNRRAYHNGSKSHLKLSELLHKERLFSSILNSVKKYDFLSNFILNHEPTKRICSCFLFDFHPDLVRRLIWTLRQNAIQLPAAVLPFTVKRKSLSFG